jgi:molybdopterin molybdotransferase
MRGFAHRTDVDEALRIVLRHAETLGAEVARLEAAAGRVLAADVVAPISVPGFDRAMMDGYAVHAEETFGATPYDPARLEVIGESLPGRPFARAVARGRAVRIMTGAALPEGADAVVPAESARESPGDRAGEVEIRQAVPPGRHVGSVGEDVTAGDLLLRRGRVLRPQDVGVLASVGLAEAPLVRRPRVGIVVTGDELLPPGSTPTGCRIVDSNSLTLEALVRRDAGLPTRGSIVPDRREAVEAAILAAADRSDLVLVSGGSSVGVEDHAPAVVASVGRLLVHGVAMRPSSPAGFGIVRSRPVFLLPGNPVSCLCAYDFFAGPAVRRLGGRSAEWPHRRSRGTLSRKIASAVGRVDYVRVRCESGKVEPIGISGASILTSATRADGFVIVSKASEGYPVGAEVEVFHYDEGGGTS